MTRTSRVCSKTNIRGAQAISIYFTALRLSIRYALLNELVTLTPPPLVPDLANTRLAGHQEASQPPTADTRHGDTHVTLVSAF